ncbi:hypothetical protein [Aliagarivorans marinus]|uniref:hypothetical protein n=1 Tax=Aliagarivorans marinus TaxID=561965 RepID=UPI0004213EBF|nr:hypothetical protein [Aliagarivorans marinus]
MQGIVNASLASLIWRSCLIVALLASAPSRASIPTFDHIDLNSNQMLEFKEFPYRDYFVCIRISDVPELATHLQYDPVIRESWRKVVGETSARFYRYIHDLPEKAMMADTPLADASGRFTKEPQPFTFDRQYFYPYQALSRGKHDYHYDLHTKEMYRNFWGDRSQRYWIAVTHRFYQRESDYKVRPLDQLGELFVMLSMDMDAVRAAKSEQDAYRQGSKSSRAYFFKANPKDCRAYSGE